MSIEERHKNVIEILRLELENGMFEYTLDLPEVYSLVDGFNQHRQRIETLENTLRVVREACRVNLTYAGHKNEKSLYNAFMLCDEALAEGRKHDDRNSIKNTCHRTRDSAGKTKAQSTEG